jgi:hypothetical protein
MLLRDDHGPFSSRAESAFFFPNPEPGTDSFGFPKHPSESDSSAVVESEKWKYRYEEMDGG